MVKAKAREKAKAKENLKLGCVLIVTSIILQKLGTFLTADHYQVKNASLIPTRAMTVTSDIKRNHPLG